MNFQDMVFYGLAILLTGAALGVIFARSTVHAALSLVLAFFTAAGLWILLQAEFLAIALVLVYVGAVMVLFLFVVMMLDTRLTRLKQPLRKVLFPALVVGGVILVELVLVLSAANFPVKPVQDFAADYSSTATLGRVLYTVYVYPFELAAVVLLVAIVAAIALTHRRRSHGKYINPAWQIRVQRQNRVRLVTVKSGSAVTLADKEHS